MTPKHRATRAYGKARRAFNLALSAVHGLRCPLAVKSGAAFVQAARAHRRAVKAIEDPTERFYAQLDQEKLRDNGARLNERLRACRR